VFHYLYETLGTFGAFLAPKTPEKHSKRRFLQSILT